ncbi:hypothetical protein KBY27_19835 [Ruegeria pomeroyi]|uniref:Uncharacterized protein n=1 Tax=Ruegeria pomeroyi TaxID=89184 RepID=A0A9Q3WPG6_9RHOB|nr:hypothetical protein [Ruegeria pomeroyi]MCE8539718.1 hypothetical protein [Ruegeria pomeroyi]
MKNGLLIMTGLALIGTQALAEYFPSYIKTQAQRAEYRKSVAAEIKVRVVEVATQCWDDPKTAERNVQIIKDQLQRAISYKITSMVDQEFGTVALKCINLHSLERHGWYPQVPAFMTSREKYAWDREQAELTESQLRQAQAEVRAKAKAELEHEISKRVNAACQKLAQHDSVAAYTNATCIASFLVNGLPTE